MRNFMLGGLAALAVMSLVGCISVPDKVMLPAGQALAIAEASVTGINQTATVAANSGLINGQKAVTVKAGIDSANLCVRGANQLYSHGDIPGTVKSLNQCLKSAADVQTSLHPLPTPGGHP